MNEDIKKYYDEPHFETKTATLSNHLLTIMWYILNQRFLLASFVNMSEQPNPVITK